MSSAAEALKRLATPFIDTRTSQRRAVTLGAFDDLARETDLIESAAHPAGQGLRVTGNWTAGQILEHLARAIERSMDGFTAAPASAELIPRGIGRLTARARRSRAEAQESSLKSRLVSSPHAPAGPSIALPGELDPAELAWTPDGAARLRVALQRIRDNHPMDKPSPTAGPLSPAEWSCFHLRHAELHLSFIILGERD